MKSYFLVICNGGDQEDCVASEMRNDSNDALDGTIKTGTQEQDL